ncbi:hypothetical protein CEW92_01110 [Bacillaceae bacterium SAS-127]|nr:hypothetical protein CEW92_01110 [Bacillaceae bacterium SAS-127]
MAYQPKSYRKFVATAATATLVATAVTPAFAAGFTDVSDRYKEAVDYLVKNEITQGMTETKFGVQEKIKRVDAAKMIALALKLDTTKAPASGFTDVPKRAEGYVNALKAEGIISGKSDTKFGSEDTLTRGEMAIIIDRAYKLTDKAEVKFTDVSDRYADSVAKLVAAGITQGKTETQFGTGYSITRGEFAIFVFRAENPTPKPVVETKVESVSAINASELKVTFTQPVTEKTAEDKANYELKINNVKVAQSGIADIELSADGKVATILLDQSATKSAFQNGDKYVIQTNDAIVSKDGKKLEKFVSNEATFSETAAPALTKVAKKGNSLELTFDRPVNAVGTGDVTLVKIDGIEIGSKELKPVSPKTVGSDVLGEAGDYRYTIDITDATAKAEAKKVGTHEVVIFDVEDTASAYAAKASVLTGSYTVTDAVTTPEVTGIEAVNANRFFVYTNVDVELDANSVIKVNKGTHEFKVDNAAYNGTINKSSAVTVTDAVTGTYNKKPGIWVTVTDNEGNTSEENPLYRSGEAAVNLSVTVEKYTADGLIGKKSTQNVTLNKNNTKPVVDTTSVAADEKSLIVKFTNELVKLDGTTGLTLTEGTDYVVRNKEGIIVTGFTAAVSGKEITFRKGSEDLKDAPYTVEFKEGKFKNQEDRNNVATYLANTVKNDAFTVTVGKEAQSNFKYTEFKFDTSGTATNNTNVVDTVNENSITFKLPAKMGDSARDVANYTLDGKALPAGTTVDFVNDRQTVKVVFPKGTFKTSTQYKFGITTNVKTEAGSMIVGSLQTKAPAELVFGVKDNVKPELASALYYVGTETVTTTTKTNQIEVTFNEAVNVTTGAANDPANDFSVMINGSKYDVDAVTQATMGDDKDRKVVLTLKDSINVSQAATINIIPEADQVGASAAVKEIAVQDTAGNKAKEGSQTTLAAGKVKYSAALAAQAADQEAAQTVINQIAALPASVTLTDETAVTSARTAYNALTTSQKALVTNLDKLTAAEAKIVELKDAKAVADAKAAITALNIAWDTDVATTVAAANTAINGATLPTGVTATAAAGTDANAGKVVITITKGAATDASIVIAP